jgi:hypothetical protein
MTRKAWPLIGSLTRTVDYLQLTIEPSASQTGALMNPLKLVPPTENWTQLEERRRLFWVIFQLDRYGFVQRRSPSVFANTSKDFVPCQPVGTRR